MLPLYLSCKPKAPVKAAQCKIVLDTDGAAQPLTELFGDFLYAYQTSGTTADGVDAVGGLCVCMVWVMWWCLCLVGAASPGAMVDAVSDAECLRVRALCVPMFVVQPSLVESGR